MTQYMGKKTMFQTTNQAFFLFSATVLQQRLQAANIRLAARLGTQKTSASDEGPMKRHGAWGGNCQEHHTTFNSILN